MGFFNSNRNRAANIAVSRRGNMRSPQAQNRRIVKTMMYDNKTHKTKEVSNEIYITKKQAEAQELGFLGYSLKYGNVMLIGNIEDILPDYKDDQYNNVIRNNVFEGIKADKLGIVYSPKKKQFMIIGLNDDYSSSILFKNEDINQLPNIENIDLDNIEYTNLQIIENANRLLNSVYNRIDILDLTSNPILVYDVKEIFKK